MINIQIWTQKNSLWIGIFLFLIYFSELLRTAWIGDDAAITLRVIMNTINGYGPVFNIDERVQAYTHPLWFILNTLLTLITKNVFLSIYALSFLCSITSFILLWQISKPNIYLQIAVIFGLIFSKAVVDYSTSGLENPLTHVLIITTLLSYQNALLEKNKKSGIYFFLNLSLLYLNRMDIVLIFIPLSTYLLIKLKTTILKKIQMIFIGTIPAFCWTIFSLLYYGFPFPNTAYAKIGTGIEWTARIIQGSFYFLNSWREDSFTLMITSICLFLLFKKDITGKMVAFGIFLYFLYILQIGGDFMSGRFFTSPMITSLCCMSLFYKEGISLSFWQSCLIFPSSLLCIIFGLYQTVLVSVEFHSSEFDEAKIADERAFYFQRHGLFSYSNQTNPLKSNLKQPIWEQKESRKVTIHCGGLGYISLYSGPSAHLIDTCALTDPLLARLPARDSNKIRIGHFFRHIPVFYIESIQYQKNMIQNPFVHSLYDSIKIITQDSIFSKTRLIEVIKINLGMIHYPTIEEAGLVQILWMQLPLKTNSISQWNDPQNTTFGKVLEIALPQKTIIHRLHFYTDCNDFYRVDVLQRTGWVQLGTVTPDLNQIGMISHTLENNQLTEPIQTVRITGMNGDSYYSLGSFEFE